MYSFSDFALEHLKIDTLISYYCQELGQRRESESSAVPHNLQIRDLGLRITFLTINKLLGIFPAQLSNTNPRFKQRDNFLLCRKSVQVPMCHFRRNKQVSLPKLLVNVRDSQRCISTQRVQVKQCHKLIFKNLCPKSSCLGFFNVI